MQKKTRVLGFMMMLCTVSLFASSMEVSGTISSSTTWTGVDTVKVTGNIRVLSGRTLTIDPGIYVEFQGYYTMDIEDTLLALGTSSNRITFTAINQVNGWNRIFFDDTSTLNDSSKFVYCQLEYSKGSPGGALWIHNYDQVLVSHCIFSNNYTGCAGGAVFLDQSSIEFINNEVTNNEAGNYAGGICCSNGSNALFINNTICSNTVTDTIGGGGWIACVFDSDPIFRNTILYDNSAQNGAQVYLDDDSDPNFYYCDIEGGSGNFYVNGSYNGDYENCFDEIPLFTDSGDFPYDLALTSPCINFGDPETSSSDTGDEDLAGNSRFLQDRIDVGAYETSFSASSIEVAGDITLNTVWVGVDTVKVTGDIYVNNGKTLTISPGTYVEFQGHYKLQVDGTLIAIGTASDRITFTAADHDEGWNSMVFDYTSTSNDSTKIVYCILQYGKATTGDSWDKCGGALWISYFDKILISNCFFENNYADDDGGAIFLWYSNASFFNNIFIENEADSWGGAIVIYYAQPEFINNTICNNTANNGGGICCYSNADPTIINTILFANSASYGDQISLMYNDSNPNFYFCNVEGGVDAFHTFEVNYTGDFENCIDVEPQFVGSGDYPYDLSENSPCVNSGDPATNIFDVGDEDLSGETRILQNRIDIGAYESLKYPDNIPGYTLEFDGIDDHIIVSHNDIRNPSGRFSITLWAKLNSMPAGNADLISKHVNEGGSARSGYVIEYDPASGIGTAMGTSSGWRSVTGSSWSVDEWHHLALTYDAASELLTFYDNGVIQGNTSVTSPLYNDEDLWLAGSAFYGNYCNCNLDEIAYWNTARTTQEIRESMYLPLSGTETGLVSYWQFNDGFGEYCNEFISGNYGTLTNMDTETCWLDSPIPVGIGESDTYIFNDGSGYYYFSNDIHIGLFNHTGTDTIVVTRLETSPNINPSDVYETLDSQYFIFDRFGNGTFNAVVGFLFLQDDLTYEDWQNPEQIQLYRRESNSVSDWSFLQYAYSITPQPDNIVYFDGIDEFGQLIICRNLLPDIEISPLSFNVEMQRGENSIQHLTIENTGTGDLEFQISLNQSRDSGGPDVFGYEWTDSDETGGPTYDWFDISSVGTEIISNGDWTYSVQGDADDAYKEVTLPFIFYFYGEAKENIKISSNGYLTFGNDGTDMENNSIPDSNEPNDLIAPFWFNLDTTDNGNIYYYDDQINNKFIVQYQDVQQQGVPSQIYTFQVILYENGEILFQYEDMSTTYFGSAGIENRNGSDGLEIFYRESYIHNSLAVKFTTLYWLSLETYSGSVPAASPMDIDVYFKTRNLTAGEYTDSLTITSNDPFEPEVIVPVTLTISDSLAVPQNVTIEIVGTDVQLNWDAVSEANSYKIYASSNPYAADWGTEIASVSETSWISDITGIDKKFYRVVASTESVTRDSSLEKRISRINTVNELQKEVSSKGIIPIKKRKVRGK